MNAVMDFKDTDEDVRSVEGLLALNVNGLFSDAVARLRTAERNLNASPIKSELDLLKFFEDHNLDFFCTEMIEVLKRGGQAEHVAQQLGFSDVLFANLLILAQKFLTSDSQKSLDIKLIKAIEGCYLRGRARLAGALRESGLDAEIQRVTPFSFGEYPKKVQRGIIGKPEVFNDAIQALLRNPPLPRTPNTPASV